MVLHDSKLVLYTVFGILGAIFLFQLSIFMQTRLEVQNTYPAVLEAVVPKLRSNKIAQRNFSMYWTIEQSQSLDMRKSQHAYAQNLLTPKQHILSSLFQHSFFKSNNISHFKPFDAYSKINIWDLFPPVMSCPDIERVGNVGDGGKWICGLDQMSSQSNPCIVYSFGVSTDISFEIELLKRTACILHLFDPTIGAIPLRKNEEKLRTMTNLRQKKLNKIIKLPNGVSDNSSLLDSMRRVFFHKSALSTTSGATAQHVMNEHIFDTMRRLNHNFISLLKVDIEGAEWTVFADLFGTLDDKNKRQLPFGQLLIELHHESNTKTIDFFAGASMHGYYPFSREINLQPCLAGRKPIAVEYSFLNAQRYYYHHEEKWPVPVAIHPSWHIPIKGVLYILTQRSRMKKMYVTMRLLYENFLSMYSQYPLVIFHDDYTSDDELLMKITFPNIKIHFIRITLSLPNVPFQFVGKIPDRTVCSPTTSSIGYRHMCRFHAFLASKYLSEYGFDDFEYHWRLDDDSIITHPIGYDVFQFMKWNKKLYGFINIVEDGEECVEGLENLANTFLNESNIQLNMNDSFFNILKLPSIFYNNFEISHASLWRNPLWLRFADIVDRSFGIYMHRWGDAPLRTIGVGMMVGKNQLHSFTDIGYQHSPFVDQKPSGLPFPYSDPFRGSKNCRFYDRWICNSTDGNVFNYTTRLVPDKSTSHQSTPMVVTEQNLLKGVLYTFGHAGREEVLVSTINSLFYNYARIHSRRIVVFYSKLPEKGGLFNPDKLISTFPTEVKESVSFVPVSLLPLSGEFNRGCVGSDDDVRAASEFLRFKAFQVLKSYGFQWFLRFGDDSQLLQPVKCMHEMQSLGQALCDTYLEQLKVNSKSCRKYLTNKDIEEGRIILSIFEASHISVWESDTCLAIFYAAGDAFIRDKADSRLVNVSRSLSDSQAHNLCVQLALPPSAMGELDDVMYAFKWRNDVYASLDNNATVQVSNLNELNDVFSPQRVGWLGGDAAASIPLPSTTGDIYAPPRKIAWVFADSLIGVSTTTRRIWKHSHGISNSVGISTMEDGKDMNQSVSHIRRVKSMKYFWSTNSEGEPAPIFSKITGDCGSDKSGFWPISGVAVLPPVDCEPSSIDDLCRVRLIIIGKLICRGMAASDVEPEPYIRQSKNAPTALSFRHLAAVVVVVNNPYDEPDLWEYQFRIFPSFDLSTVSSSSKKSIFARHSEDVFLLATTSDASSSVSPSQQVLLRIAAADLMLFNFDNLRILSSSESSMGGKESQWKIVHALSTGSMPAQRVDPVVLYEPGSTEASLHFDQTLNRWVIVCMLSMERVIRACRTADEDIESGWNCFVLAEVDSKWAQIGSVFSYAGRAHPSLMTVPTLLAPSNSKGRNTLQTDGNYVVEATLRSFNHNNSRSGNTSFGATAMVISFVPNALKDVKSLFDEVYFNVYTPKFLYVVTT
eukprot:gene28902-37919_t